MFLSYSSDVVVPIVGLLVLIGRMFRSNAFAALLRQYIIESIVVVC